MNFLYLFAEISKYEWLKILEPSKPTQICAEILCNLLYIEQLTILQEGVRYIACRNELVQMIVDIL